MLAPKKILLIYGVLALLIHESFSERSSFEEWIEQIKQLGKQIKEDNLVETKNGVGTVGTHDLNLDFACQVSEDRTEPLSVHQLRPEDIDVVGALGDSLTAANGANATSVPGILREYRGLSWSAGGEGDAESILTLPNILRVFNPNLKGYSIGIRFGDDKDWGFNVAVPGSRARDIPRQAKSMIEKMKADPEVNFEEDWKLVNVFIGGNDLCAIRRSSDAQPEKYIQFLREGLDVLHSEMPRTFVSLVNILEIHLLPEVAQGFGSTDECRRAQKIFCNYVAAADETELEVIKDINAQYQDLIDSLVKSGRYDTRDDFTVVVQPFLRNTVLPYTEDGQVDSTYFAPDCFHFSTKGHAMGAVNLWNNLLEPVGQKSTEWSLSEIKCPTAISPYIYTSKNSLLRGPAPAEVLEEKSLEESNGSSCVPSNTVESWIIALLCVLSAIIFIQMAFIAGLVNSRRHVSSDKKVLVE